MMAQHDQHDASRQNNRLIHETSPYLLQHAHNPVDWYPWGDEAFARARADDKPVLLSVGYSACHWCHVMAHESFENPAIAEIMNRDFVCVKVDREERPDIDALYMDAVQALTGHGGWPMTVFLTPDGAPFYGGTYFPPRDRNGMSGFPTVLTRLAEYYRSRRAEVEEQARAFREFYREQGERRLELPAHLAAMPVPDDMRRLDDAADRLLAQIDAVNGGFGRAPKFPHPMALAFLMRMELRHREQTAGDATDPRLLQLVRLTLDKMAGGGVYDQVGGGFHRYATDASWLVPHFEKMLYDNALLARAYLAAWQLTGEVRYRDVCQDVLDYVIREMTDPEGGFYATQDADSEGEEGRFYIWTREELEAGLPPEDFALAERLWGITAAGNFESGNILYVARPLDDVALELGLSADEAASALGRVRAKLYALRARRTWPGRDDKVIASWNGLMLRAMADAGRVLGRADYLAAAESNARFLLRELVADGRVRRTWRQGQAKLDGYLEDYAALANALLSTYEATGNVQWFTAARALADAVLERFWDQPTASFFDCARDHETLIGRPRELTDNATPSGTSLAAECLLRLGAFTGDEHYRVHTEQVLLALAPLAVDQPSAFGHLLCALDDLIGPMPEIAVVGGDDRAMKGLLGVVNGTYLPRSVLAVADPADAAARAAIPLLAERGLLDGLPAAYVCQDFACQVPTSDPMQLQAQLAPHL